MCPFPISNIELSCISITSNIENNISYPFSPNTSNLLHAFLYVSRIHHFFFHHGNFSLRFQFKYYYKGHLNKKKTNGTIKNDQLFQRQRNFSVWKPLPRDPHTPRRQTSVPPRNKTPTICACVSHLRVTSLLRTQTLAPTRKSGLSIVLI